MQKLPRISGILGILTSGGGGIKGTLIGPFAPNGGGINGGGSGRLINGGEADGSM